MNNNILVTLPRYEVVTHYLSAWSKLSIERAGDFGFKVIKLEEKRANKKELESYTGKLNIRFIILNGHGDNDSVAGQDDESILQKGVNDHIVKPPHRKRWGI